MFTVKKNKDATLSLRTIYPTKPHVSLHDPDSLFAVWLFIKQFDRRFRLSIWPTPTH